MRGLEGTIEGMWNRVLVVVVALHMAHVPVPIPDLDGEWQGVAIGGLSDPAAWGFMMLGVRPADDIDRGPIRDPESSDTSGPAASVFGEAAIADHVGSALPASVSRTAGGADVPASLALPSPPPGSAGRACTEGLARCRCGSVSPGAARAALCVWHI